MLSNMLCKSLLNNSIHFLPRQVPFERLDCISCCQAAQAIYDSTQTARAAGQPLASQRAHNINGAYRCASFAANYVRSSQNRVAAPAGADRSSRGATAGSQGRLVRGESQRFGRIDALKRDGIAPATHGAMRGSKTAGNGSSSSASNAASIAGDERSRFQVHKAPATRQLRPNAGDKDGLKPPDSDKAAAGSATAGSLTALERIASVDAVSPKNPSEASREAVAESNTDGGGHSSIGDQPPTAVSADSSTAAAPAPPTNVLPSNEAYGLVRSSPPQPQATLPPPQQQGVCGAQPPRQPTAAHPGCKRPDGPSGRLDPVPAAAHVDPLHAEMIERDIIDVDLGISFEDIGGLAAAKALLTEAIVLPMIVPEFFQGEQAMSYSPEYVGIERPIS